MENYFDVSVKSGDGIIETGEVIESNLDRFIKRYLKNKYPYYEELTISIKYHVVK